MSSSKPLAILAILATLLLAGVVTLQALEWNFYQAEPSVWAPR